MPIILVAAVLAATPPSQLASPTCRPPALQQTAEAGRAAPPHPLGDEPPAGLMHAVLREVSGCVVVDVPTYRAGWPAWEYRLAGPVAAWEAPTPVLTPDGGR